MILAILEDNTDRQAAMRSALEERFAQYDLRFFDDAEECIQFLEANRDNVLVAALDHDLEMKMNGAGRCIDPGTGRDVANFLAERSPSFPVVIHSTNTAAAVGMEMALTDAGWETQRVTPFGNLGWIKTEWFRAMRRAIVGTARALAKGSR